jgi:hypothetical protein
MSKMPKKIELFLENENSWGGLEMLGILGI